MSNDSPRGTRIAHIGLAVQRLEEILPLYREILGLSDVPLDNADGARIVGLSAGDSIVEHLATSARNKGCTRIEVSEPLASAEPSRWKRLGFASRGRTLGRQIG